MATVDNSLAATAVAPTPEAVEIMKRPSSLEQENYNPFMHAACSSAMAGITLKHGGPFGACIVKNGVMVAVAHNMVLCNLDPSCHAEMTCIRAACKALGTHDLSCCELYTTCEPCPMCWGAANWARLKKIHIGATRTTAAKYGFDDEFFYQQIDLPHHERAIKHMMSVNKEDCKKVFEESNTYKRRMKSGRGLMAKIYESLFEEDEAKVEVKDAKNEDGTDHLHELAHGDFMKAAVEAAEEGQRLGESKEREPFGAVVVKDGKVLASAYNTVLKDGDPTATAEVNAIRKACKALGTYKLDGCALYTTTEPDPMSLGCIYWARISELHIGVSQKLAAAFGFEDGLLHYKELECNPEERCIETAYDVMHDECERVFQQWQAGQGTIY
uniref:CMP/dCMP-type deaminase domain-containing protein n=1 Tax=Chromera velia CCMP2878 TaxID=1169474 RepID=A0A0G4GIJ4_9ALVE|mmetsp:Transcript_46132/g.90925  ORF Transcript_46132/g.90925 Transcript_46132/m.90925 type:complete len:385 (-) Transcript_46132:524-1678(-)|eukprot:Cvel_21991.t1-p1 / transcript=Cvel_21991.t1 / gene=Cvel_21991 / organism=Chromera_velia_CCMP2878 / gene_product=Guanine deaminase, putative / transcript_product=Guanine deaminase, putative / location=Cvel_scaffold2118:14007-18050(+) / protein_length=384 / sequence_SO=supercontig / SO=protein_coding / is_pseudo=false